MPFHLSFAAVGAAGGGVVVVVVGGGGGGGGEKGTGEEKEHLCACVSAWCEQAASATSERTALSLSLSLSLDLSIVKFTRVCLTSLPLLSSPLHPLPFKVGESDLFFPSSSSSAAELSCPVLFCVVLRGLFCVPFICLSSPKVRLIALPASSKKQELPFRVPSLPPLPTASSIKSVSPSLPPSFTGF